jgi:hypothetical protein
MNINSQHFQKVLFILLTFSVVFSVNAFQKETEYVTIRPEVNNDVLSNPGIGFTTMGAFDGEVQGYPKSTVAYFRWYWNKIMPAEDVYDWSVIDEVITKARIKGQRLACGIMPVNGTGAPQWYIDLGANGFDYVSESGKQNWMPDHNDPLFMEHFGKLIEEFAKRYDGHPDIDHVDMRSLGHWGEWHFAFVNPTPTVRPEIRRALVDIFIDNFKKTPLLMLIGGSDELTYSIFKGTGWRADCLGDMGFWGSDWNHMEYFYQQALDAANANDAWRHAPVAFESCGVMQDWLDKGYDVDFIFNEALRWHCSIFNNKSSAVPTEWLDETNEFLKKMGYRFRLRYIRLPADVTIGDSIKIETEWENVGVAPIYRKYLLAFKLQGILDNEPIMMKVQNNDFDIRTWLPGIHKYHFDFEIPSDTTPGRYKFSVALLDSIKMEPAVKLANMGIDANGWYDLFEYKMDEGKMQIIVTESKLSQNYPNPFNSGTTIDYQLDISSNVKIEIYNIEGQLIKLLISEYKTSGYYSLTWDGTNDNGVKVPSGTYIYRIKTGGGFVKEKKMVYIK